MKRKTTLFIFAIFLPIAIAIPAFNIQLREVKADHLGKQVCVDKPTGSYCYYEEDEIEPIPVPPEYICEKNPHAGGCEYHEGLPEDDATTIDFRRTL